MMIFIECESCKSRFRLDTKTFKGYKAMRARCRKCGALIEASNPVMPAAMQGTEDRQPPLRARPMPPLEPSPTGRGKQAQNTENLFERANSWRDEGINGLPSPQHPTSQHRKTKTGFHGYGYPSISNYVLVYAVLLFVGCSAYVLFRIFISYLN